jgi:hypothetical protein
VRNHLIQYPVISRELPEKITEEVSKAANRSITICFIKSVASSFINFSLTSYILLRLNLRPFITATCGYRHQAQENPFEGEQVEAGVDPLEEKVESNVSVSACPQDGQTT